jgi:hypothetical protein
MKQFLSPKAFWFESFQKLAERIFSGCIYCNCINLAREKDSLQSKPVDMPHHENYINFNQKILL